MHPADTGAGSDEQMIEHVLEQLRSEGTISVTGADISAELLARLLDAAPEDPNRPGQPLFGNVDFRNATFKDVARFDGATFEGVALFDGATFERDAFFRGATFKGPATVEGMGGFQDTTFKGAARFDHATFDSGAPFDGATFEGTAVFFRAILKGWAGFGATFKRHAAFYSATFEDATFDGTSEGSTADFSGATFSGGAGFSDAHFTGRAWFGGATFERDRGFGPVRAEQDLVLNGTLFNEPMRLVVSASQLDCSGAQFRRGADIFVRRAVIVLDDADFAEPSMLAPWLDAALGDEPGVREDRRFDEEPPRLVSLRRTKVASLTITGLDLRACRFEGAHGLDRLRLERVRFAETPSGWQRSRRWRVPIRWTRRLAIAEEHHWRAERAGASGWYGPELRAPSALESALPTPEQIAATYRALRKGREDSKDEPGAADFYYGEMEMRRQKPKPGAHGAERPPGGGGAAEHEGIDGLANGVISDAVSRPALTAERLILGVYWLVSGYGLRAGRALSALAQTAFVFAFLFDLWGFQPDRGFGRALLFSVESTSSLFRAPEMEGFALTASGEVLQIVLRLLGPLFFGLALLSLRGRVKR